MNIHSGISLKDLGIAYRKAKVDLYYSSHASLNAIADYEENLHKNLQLLLESINGESESWVENPDFLGTWTIAPKSIKLHTNKKDCNGLIYANPKEEWKCICKLTPTAQFRLMAQCSLDFHVFSTLWMMKVGHLFDAQLGECAYGNRLRRTRDGDNINPFSLGSLQPYLNPFRNWRDKGIKAMQTALDAEKSIIALTADVSSFYHELNAGFMLSSYFIKEVMHLKLNREQEKIHRLFIHALQEWAKLTPLKKGLPVGLPASAIVANSALIELDRIIKQQIVPIYYGRYVDDIILVIENSSNFQSAKEVWEWIFARSSGKLYFDKNNYVCFNTDYFRKSSPTSTIHFENEKNKVFILEGESGKNLVDSIAHQIHERASEWRSLPRLPSSPENIGVHLLTAAQNDGDAADSLRKTDALTMRRSDFAIKLRDFEAYERDLSPDVWKPTRKAFFRAFIHHVLVPTKFFDLALYLPRVIKLATACEDFQELRQIIDSLEEIINQVKEHCSREIKSCSLTGNNENIEERWRKQLFTDVLESIIAAFPTRLSKVGQQEWDKHMKNCTTEGIEIVSTKDFQKKNARLFSFDLAHLPFRFIGLPKEMLTQRNLPAKKAITIYRLADDILDELIINGIKELSQWLKFRGDLFPGFLFATRPFNLPELFILDPQAYTKSNKAMKDVVLALRGFSLNEKTPHYDNNHILQIPESTSFHKYPIAVSSWETKADSWTAAAMRKSDPDTKRYARLCRILDNIISQPQQSRYLILPELSLPANWFIRIARKLQGRGISFIAGVEYLHSKKSKVRNQVWAALSHDGLGFPSFLIYRQDKQHPALLEEQELQRLAHVKMCPDKRWKTPPIIQHGDLRFSILICSELTNINYRASLRGKIDVLFVPEWNQDTVSFNALVESAALDIHAYIVQCNDRQYGDSRIRAPFKESWKRDVLKVKGGVTDYCVIGEIDVQALRKFQSSHRSPKYPFKPVPDGFEIDRNRRVLPIKET